MGVGLSAGGSADMFLFVKGQKAGIIKGESVDSKHADEIDVVSWSWGMQGRATLSGTAAPTGRATIRELKIVKNVDSASTPLMAALRTNEMISKAVLTVRKAGKTALEYLKITIENGRVIAFTIDAREGETGPQVVEQISFSFNKIQVEYTPQGKDGLGGPSTMFTDEFHEQA